MPGTYAAAAADVLEDSITALVGPIAAPRPPATKRIEFFEHMRAKFARVAWQYEFQCLVCSLGRIGALRREAAAAAVGDVQGPVLELCCGTGGVTIELSKRFERVIGVDLSPHMLKRARKRMKRAGVKNVELREADVSTLRFPEGQFAAIVISLGMHELPRWTRDFVLAQAARWLKPGGRFVFCDYVASKNRWVSRMLRWIGCHAIEKHFGEFLEYPLVERLEEHGFTRAETRRSMLSSYETSAWLAPTR